MRTSTWKHTERRTARDFGGERVPVNGRGETSDVQHDWLAIECKHRRLIPAWIKKALKQARGGNTDGQKLPIAVIHESGARYDDDVVMMYKSDFIDWFGAK